MSLLFNWPRRTPYLNQLDRAQRETRLGLPCDGGRCHAPSRPAYPPTIVRSLTAPAAIVAPGALGLCAERPLAMAGGLCPVCRSGIVNGNRKTRLLCCTVYHSPACPACGVVFDDADETTGRGSSSSNNNSNKHSQQIKGQTTKGADKGGRARDRHQQDFLLKPAKVIKPDQTSRAKKKPSGKSTEK